MKKVYSSEVMKVYGKATSYRCLSLLIVRFPVDVSAHKTPCRYQKQIGCSLLNFLQDFAAVIQIIQCLFDPDILKIIKASGIFYFLKGV